MKKFILLFALAIFSFTSFAQKKATIKGDKNVTTITNNISKEFNAIEVDDALVITLIQGNQNSYTLMADSNLQDIVQFTVKDGLLKIQTTNRITSSKKLDIMLTFKNLEYITIKKDAELKGKERIESDILHINTHNTSKFDLEIIADEVVVTMQDKAKGKLEIRSDRTTIVMNDKTDLDARMKTDRTTVMLTKSAKLKLEGDTDKAEYKLEDSAELNAKKMKASSADLKASNNTNVQVYVKRKLEVLARDKSTIYVYGNPKIEVDKFTDKSKIINK